MPSALAWTAPVSPLQLAIERARAEHERRLETRHEAPVPSLFFELAARERAGSVREVGAKCCPRASRNPCVCLSSWRCPVHGRTCYGSHE